MCGQIRIGNAFLNNTQNLISIKEKIDKFNS